MALKLPEAATTKSGIKRAVQEAYDSFCQKHAQEGPFLEYLNKEWRGQIGEVLCSPSWLTLVASTKVGSGITSIAERR